VRHGTFPPVRILVIEDDDDIRKALVAGLSLEGFEVSQAGDGATGLDLALVGGWAAVVIDLLMPGVNGYEVCAAIRAAGSDVPIMVVTAKSGELDQIDLLDLGADDFLTKPASAAVVAARLRALARRRAATATNRIERGSLSYDLATRQCLVDGRHVALTHREGQLLRTLLLANGSCVGRQELFEHVWGYRSGVDSTNLDIYVRRLRDKLAPVTVDNVRGLGYRVTG
jgi:DNA-binding response OmpR family regulator